MFTFSGTYSAPWLLLQVPQFGSSSSLHGVPPLHRSSVLEISWHGPLFCLGRRTSPHLLQWCPPCLCCMHSNSNPRFWDQGAKFAGCVIAVATKQRADVECFLAAAKVIHGVTECEHHLEWVNHHDALCPARNRPFRSLTSTDLTTVFPWHGFENTLCLAVRASDPCCSGHVGIQLGIRSMDSGNGLLACLCT